MHITSKTWSLGWVTLQYQFRWPDPLNADLLLFSDASAGPKHGRFCIFPLPFIYVTKLHFLDSRGWDNVLEPETMPIGATAVWLALGYLAPMNGKHLYALRCLLASFYFNVLGRESLYWGSWCIEQSENPWETLGFHSRPSTYPCFLGKMPFLLC